MLFLRISSIFAVLLILAQQAEAQLSKGHQILLNYGLQIQALAQDDCYFHVDTMTNLNYTAVHWDNGVGTNDTITTHASRPDLIGDPPGVVPWARWALNEFQMPPLMTPYGGDETPYTNSLMAIILADEWNLNDDATRNRLVNWFTSVRTNWPNALLFHNNYGSQVLDAPLSDFYQRAQPDMLSFDTYPWMSVYDTNQVNSTGPAIPGPPTGWYGDLRRYREHARAAGIPLALYRQTFHSVQDYDQHVFRDPSPSELRLLTFAGLAFNAKFFIDFTYNTGASSLFTHPFGYSGDLYTNSFTSELGDINFRALNLGKSLIRLTGSTTEGLPGFTTSIMFVRGKDPNGNLNPIPVGFLGDQDTGKENAAYTDWVFQRNDPYLAGWGVTNKAGIKNNGQQGDVIISWFKPLDESFDGPDYTNEVYMMVVNGLTDPTGTSADCMQEITLNFLDNFTAIEMMDPLTGNVQVQQLPVVSGRRKLVLDINGGDGVLFKFADGAPFIGGNVIGPAYIGRQPSNAGAPAGSNAVFSVGAVGAAPITYQWFFNGAPINNATNSSYTRPSVQASDVGNYNVVVSNASGSATSSVVTIIIQTAPQITSQPQSQNAIVTGTASFSVTATGNPAPAFQWRFNGTDIPGATNNTYSRTNLQGTDAGTYSVLVSNAVTSVLSSDATLTVKESPTITSQPQNQAALSGGTVTFNVTAVGTGVLTYQWKKNGNNLTDGGNISGSSTATLTVSSIQNSDLATYTVAITNSFGGVVSSPATLAYAVTPTIQIQPQSRTNNGGTTATFNVVASGGGLSYQWRRAGTNIFDGSNISGANTDTLKIGPISKTEASSYSVVITNVAGSVTSSAATLTVVFPLPWREPFNYGAGTNLNTQITLSGLIWNDVGTSTAGPSVAASAGSLTVTNLPFSFGNSATFGGLGKSARLSFPSPFTTGTIYYSFSMKVADLTGAVSTGGFIAGFNNSTGTQTGQPSVVGGRLYLRTSGAGYNLGIAKNSDTDWYWDTNVLSLNQTVFVVGSYTFTTSANTTDDIAKLWINPSPLTFGLSNAPTPSATAATGNDISGNIASFVMFQRSASVEPAVMTVDDLRVDTSWAGVTPNATPVHIDSFTFTNGSLQLQGSGDPGNVSIQVSTNLVNWSDVSTTLSPNGTFQFTDTNSSPVRRFYRAKLSP